MRVLDLPLCVDCDGTLIAGDLLVESGLGCLAGRPFDIFHFPRWLMAGKASLKRELAQRGNIDAATLPYREEVLSFLRAEYRRGRKIYLVTAANSELADRVAAHLGIFEGVIASDGRLNLKGEAKAERLIGLFGRNGFDYAGDSGADLPVWKAARHAIAVATSPATLKRLEGIKSPIRSFPAKSADARTWLRLARIHQWAKNLLLFVPLVTSHRWTDGPALLALSLGFLTFGFVSSGTYILNDLIDIRNDRRHPSKRMRPIAAGEIAPLHGLVCAGSLFALAALICQWLPASYAMVLGGYSVLTLSYTFFFKKKLMVDVVLLAGLYTIRLIAGHAAGDIVYSVWLLAFAIFIFFSLALAKRYTELINPAIRGAGIVHGRGYQPGDEVPIASLGTGSGIISVLVMALYVNSPEVQKLYHHPMVLLGLCPLFLYWIGRIWMLAHRGALHDDPVIFALRDRDSYIVGALAGLVLVAASLA
jgi:4-hydroxybenzoate polyprenyltransferase/phosphoserine phosphatase